MKQILEHLKTNELISHNHYGAVSLKSTQTLITELYYQLLENYTTREDTALLCIDQSNAYDTVSHPILLQKLKAIGFKTKGKMQKKCFFCEPAVHFGGGVLPKDPVVHFLILVFAQIQVFVF